MTHLFTAGAFTSSTWHGLETVADMPTAEAMVRHAETTGAWPRTTELGAIYAADGTQVPGRTIAARYVGGDTPVRYFGPVSDTYSLLGMDEWRATCRAAVAAGARPAGCFALREGRQLLALFEVDGSEGFRSFLLLQDDLGGGSLKVGFTTIRVVCANTQAMAFAKDGKAFARIRHSGDMSSKAARLRDAVADGIADGTSIRQTYAKARAVNLTRQDATSLVAAVFPDANPDVADDDLTAGQRRARGRTLARRKDALAATSLEMNQERGGASGQANTLATVWNGLTWAVDRTFDGRTPVARKARGGRMESMVSGARAAEVQRIGKVVEAYLDANGDVQMVERDQTLQELGRSLLDDMLADA